MAYGDPQPTAPIVAGVPAPGTLPTYIPYAALTSEQSFTTAELATRIGQFNGSLVTTNGAATVGDGNGAQFVWVVGDTTTANGTTVLGASVYGRWRLAVAGGGGGGGLSGTSFIFPNQASGALTDGGTVAAEAIYFDGNTAARAYSGLLPPTSGKLLKVLHNRGSFAIALQHNTGTANQRFINPAGVDYTLSAGKSITLSYDTTAATWRLAAQDAAYASASGKALALDGITTAALESATGFADGAVVRTIGRGGPGDRAGGDFRRDASSSATVNGGTIRNCADGGRWIQDALGPINARIFGLHPTATGAVNSAALAAAILASASIGASLYVPGGNYNFAATTAPTARPAWPGGTGGNITKAVSVQSNVRMFGDGSNVTIFNGGTDETLRILEFIADVGDDRTVDIRGIGFAGGGEALTFHANVAGNFLIRHSVLSDLNFSGFKRVGLHFEGMSPIGCTFNQMNFDAGTPVSGENTVGILARGPYTLHYATFNGCRIANTTGNSIHIESTLPAGNGGSQGTLFNWLILENCQGHGMYLKSATVTWRGGDIENLGQGMNGYLTPGVAYDVVLDDNYDGSSVDRSGITIVGVSFGGSPRTTLTSSPTGLRAQTNHVGQWESIRVLGSYSDVSLENCTVYGKWPRAVNMYSRTGSTFSQRGTRGQNFHVVYGYGMSIARDRHGFSSPGRYVANGSAWVSTDISVYGLYNGAALDCLCSRDVPGTPYTVQGFTCLVVLAYDPLSGSTVTKIPGLGTDMIDFQASGTGPDAVLQFRSSNSTNVAVAIRGNTGITGVPIDPFGTLRFTTISNISEAGDDSNGRWYTGTATFTGSSASAPTLTLASGKDGWWRGTAVVNAGGSGIGCIVGVRTSSASGPFNTAGTYAIYRDADGVYHTITNGASGGTAAATVTAANNDAIRIRRAGTSLIAEVSKDGFLSWTTVHTWTGFTTAQIWPWLGMSTSDVFADLRHLGLT